MRVSHAVVARARSGITLTEVLISILIMGVGLVALASLFPLGLMRIQEAQRQHRSALLSDSVVGDSLTRNLLDKNTFRLSWYPAFDPWVSDSGAPGAGGVFTPFGPGLPVAYDPLWWSVNHQINPDINPDNVEGRFGVGLGFIQEPSGGDPSAHGLQRITNFLPVEANAFWPFSYSLQPGLFYDGPGDIFASQDDIVWQTENRLAPPPAFPLQAAGPGSASTVLPDLSSGSVLNDWNYSWMFTGRQMDATDGSRFEGDLVVFHNRGFALDPVNPPLGAGPPARAAGETVVEGIFGYSGAIEPPAGPGYARGPSRTVLLRWPSGMPDPDVRAGTWIADVTYERFQAVSDARFGNQLYSGQRCHWYKVVRRTPSEPDPDRGPGFRRMIVTVGTPVQSKTLLNADGTPVFANAALVSPWVVNVFARSFYVRY